MTAASIKKAPVRPNSLRSFQSCYGGTASYRNRSDLVHLCPIRWLPPANLHPCERLCIQEDLNDPVSQSFARSHVTQGEQISPSATAKVRVYPKLQAHFIVLVLRLHIRDGAAPKRLLQDGRGPVQMRRCGLLAES